MDYPTIEESNKASLNVSRLSEMQMESMGCLRRAVLRGGVRWGGKAACAVIGGGSGGLQQASTIT